MKQMALYTYNLSKVKWFKFNFKVYTFHIKKGKIKKKILDIPFDIWSIVDYEHMNGC